MFSFTNHHTGDATTITSMLLILRAAGTNSMAGTLNNLVASYALQWWKVYCRWKGNNSSPMVVWHHRMCSRLYSRLSSLPPSFYLGPVFLRRAIVCSTIYSMYMGSSSTSELTKAKTRHHHQWKWWHFYTRVWSFYYLASYFLDLFATLRNTVCKDFVL